MSVTALAEERYVSITTFKRDGTSVSTPVWCAGEDGTVLVFSEAASGKVKRIRHDPHVRITPCSARGKPRGDPLEADAAILEGTEKVETLLAKKYGWLWPAYNLLMATTRVHGHVKLPTYGQVVSPLVAR
jgi:PPOX class probable F420-dependent enzyme